MSSESSAPRTAVSNEELFKQLDNYPWDNDEEFQSGLSAILGPDPNPQQAANLALRARCFYYSRKHDITIDFPAYQAWHATHSGEHVASEQVSTQTNLSSQTVDSNNVPGPDKPPYPMSFDKIVELITTGQPIPGIKDIPDTVLEGQASQSTGSRRKKPWETEENEKSTNEAQAQEDGSLNTNSTS